MLSRSVGKGLKEARAKAENHLDRTEESGGNDAPAVCSHSTFPPSRELGSMLHPRWENSGKGNRELTKGHTGDRRVPGPLDVGSQGSQGEGRARGRDATEWGWGTEGRSWATEWTRQVNQAETQSATQISRLAIWRCPSFKKFVVWNERWWVLFRTWWIGSALMIYWYLYILILFKDIVLYQFYV